MKINSVQNVLQKETGRFTRVKGPVSDLGYKKVQKG